ncbi:MAG: histidine kinase, partial [Deltaproteobacteria bacterium]|nr:histidine kinase [Deltaproteobacteria bacterium]
TALIQGEGNLKPCLDIVKCYEKGDWINYLKIAQEIKIRDEKLPDYFLEALTWADAVTSL